MREEPDGTTAPTRARHRSWWLRRSRRRPPTARDRLTDGSLTFVFQPIVDLRDGSVVGVEGLTRVGCGEHVAGFFTDADAEGSLEDVELHAIEALLEASAELMAAGYVAVNASPSTITSARFAPLLRRFPLERLVVEVNEREVVADYGPVRDALRDLRAGGLRVAVDDAGAGTASLHHLIELDPDIIKLDGGLTDAIERHPGQQAMIRALAAFAAETGADVVAECVESAASAASLLALGIGHGQGFALGRPRPAAAS